MTCRPISFTLNNKVYTIRMPHEHKHMSNYTTPTYQNQYGFTSYKKQSSQYGQSAYASQQQSDYFSRPTKETSYGFIRTPQLPEAPSKDTYPLSPVISYNPSSNRPMLSIPALPTSPAVNLQTLYSLQSFISPMQEQPPQSQKLQQLTNSTLIDNEMNALEQLILQEQLEEKRNGTAIGKKQPYRQALAASAAI